jgi:NADPH-dependent 2,4-dienoyl-CoA reductase/sulfur reductase-like enzyme/peroxiredoxin family protein/rhodanese-related sulfurtransferase/TusA-related sulfurtransferase
MKYLVVGGVAGGATVAARLRRLDEQAEIILFERGKYVSYANCGLPYYIGDTIKDRQKLFVQTVKGFIDRFRIDIRTEQEVSAIHPEKKSVEVRNLLSGTTYTETYDKLVLSPGAEPLRPNIEGIHHPLIFTLRNVADTDAIKQHITDNHPKTVVVVGGGFIGLEMAENLHEAGIAVSVVEMANQVMAPLDFSMAQLVHEELSCKGVRLLLSDGVERFETEGERVAVCLKSGNRLSVDMVLLSIGVRPETKLAANAGLTIGTTRGIAVNKYLQTSNSDIYALGDAAEVVHGVTGHPALIPLAGPANKQGRIVADNIVLGNKEEYKGSIGTSIAKVFDLTVAAAGANAKLLKRENIPYYSSYTHPVSHAGYYPGAIPMNIKLIFSPEGGTVLGAQIVGYDGVDKRIEMLAQVIQRKGTIYDLAKLEQAYAPPYSSAKDPVNMAGFVAENILEGKVINTHWRYVNPDDKSTLVLDVRTNVEYELGHIPGSLNIPLDELREHLDELPKDKAIIATCAVGLRGYLACRILMQRGFSNVSNLSGGYKTWKVATTDWTKCGVDASCTCSAPSVPSSDDGIPEAKTIEIDACGLMCPGPIMKLKQNYSNMPMGSRLVIKATDPAFGKDVRSWCNIVGAKLIGVEDSKGTVTATIEKSDKPVASDAGTVVSKPDNKTFIVFSDDLDKALASFVLANGALAAGKKVTMFFTFWGLNVIKKRHKPAVKKDIFGKMFGMMLPSNSQKLSLSKLNMMGMGSWMMRLIMKRKKIDSLESLMQQAIDGGVEMIACTMSMDVMGVDREELLDNVELGGVAAYMERAEEANMNLFI